MRTEIMLMARDVRASSAWYQKLLGARSDHGGEEFDRIVSDDGLLLMLHHLAADEHPALANPDHGSAGDGVLLFFHVADVQQAYQRAREMKAHVLDEPHLNEQAGQLEFSLRDPDGYALTICRHKTA